MKIDVIIPNYNGAELIKNNLPQVIKSLEKTDAQIKIFIVDDFSEEEDYLKLKQLLESKKWEYEISLSRNSSNLGFSSTVNSVALSSSSDFILLLNTDVSPTPNFLLPLIEDMKKNSNLFGVGCMDESIENGKKVYRGRGIGFWKRGFFVHKKGSIEGTDTQWISGGSSFIRTDYFKTLGGFDELYNPFYWEDIDLSYRALKRGYGLMFDKNSIVIHKHSQGAIKKSFSEGTIKTIAYRNQFIFVWKNITDSNLLFSHLLMVPIYLTRSLLKGDVMFIIGFLMALVRIPKIVKKRKSQLKYFSRKDYEVLYR